MPSFNLAVPFAARRVRILPTPILSPEKETQETDEGYTSGFDAGYRAGLLQASLEARRRQQQDAQSLSQSLAALDSAKGKIIHSLGQQLPPLLLETFQRILTGHRFTAEEVGTSVAALLRQLEEARELTIECPSDLLEGIREFVEKLGLTLNTEKITWKSNPDLKPGEFRIQSNLGNVDGRHAPLIAQAKETIEGNFQPGGEAQ